MVTPGSGAGVTSCHRIWAHEIDQNWGEVSSFLVSLSRVVLPAGAVAANEMLLGTGLGEIWYPSFVLNTSAGFVWEHGAAWGTNLRQGSGICGMCSLPPTELSPSPDVTCCRLGFLPVSVREKDPQALCQPALSYTGS